MIITLICILLVIAFLYYAFPLVQIIGYSMYPTYRNSEIIVGCRLVSRAKLKIGDVIVYRCPTDNKVVVKRINKILIDNRNNRYFYCLGDNSDNSYDSRNYGYFHEDKVICKLLDQRQFK